MITTYGQNGKGKYQLSIANQINISLKSFSEEIKKKIENYLSGKKVLGIFILTNLVMLLC